MEARCLPIYLYIGVNITAGLVPVGEVKMEKTNNADLGMMFWRNEHQGYELNYECSYEMALADLNEEIVAHARGEDSLPDCYCCLPAWRGYNGGRLTLLYNRQKDALYVVES